MATNSAVRVVNDSNELTAAPGAVSMNKAIGSSAIVAATDPAFANLLPATRVLRIQVGSASVYYSIHNEVPSATTGISLAAGTIIEMSRGAWLNSQWLQNSGASTIVVFQLVD